MVDEDALVSPDEDEGARVPQDYAGVKNASDRKAIIRNIIYID